MLKKIKNFLFSKLFKINDSPQKIALGVGIGVFFGLLPGAGPAAALFLAFVFRANRGAALAASILTNTWLSLVTFILAIKVGSAILKNNWQVLQQQVQAVLKDFSWVKLTKLSFQEVFLPIIIGYLVISLISGILSYFLTWLIVRRNFYGDKKTYPKY